MYDSMTCFSVKSGGGEEKKKKKQLSLQWQNSHLVISVFHILLPKDEQGNILFSIPADVIMCHILTYRTKYCYQVALCKFSSTKQFMNFTGTELVLRFYWGGLWEWGGGEGGGGGGRQRQPSLKLSVSPNLRYSCRQNNRSHWKTAWSQIVSHNHLLLGL